MAWSRGEPFPHTSSQINTAGSRIRRSARRGQPPAPDDRKTLSDYRAWHYPALRHAQDRLRRIFYRQLSVDEAIAEVTTRPLKTESAIVAKLVRERTRLSRMQDIAGARIVVPNLELQEIVLPIVQRRFERCEPRVVKDTRVEPDRYGYRALHVVVKLEGRFVEIQIRSYAQDAWAQIVEKTDEIMGYDLKHGQGPADWLEWLHELSDELRKRDLDQPYEIPRSPWDTKIEESE